MLDYTYYISQINGTFSAWVTPKNTHDIEIISELDENYRFYRDKLNKGILLIDDYKNGVKDYTNVIRRIESNYKTGKFIFYIYLKGIEKYSGLFTYQNIKYDDYLKQGTIELISYDDYQLIFDNWEKEVNILKNTRQTVYSDYFGRLQFYVSQSDIPPPDGLWKLYYSTVLDTPGIPPNFYVYAREYCMVPRGVGISYTYTIIDDDSTDDYLFYAREYDYQYNYEAPEHNDIYLMLLYIVIVGRETDKTPVWNEDYSPIAGWNLITDYRCDAIEGYNVIPYIYIKNTAYNFEMIYATQINYVASELKSSFNYIFDNIGLPGIEVKSTFLFNDPPESTANSRVQYLSDFGCNYVTTWNLDVFPVNELIHLYIIEMSNFKRPTASNPATVNMLSLKKLYEDLNTIFENTLLWHIDENGKFRIEHVLYYFYETGLNLTQTFPSISESDGIIYNTNTRFNIKAKYNFKSIPQREVFKGLNNENIDFVDLTIRYDSPVVGSDESVIEQSCNLLSVDCDSIKENSETISDDGAVLVLCVLTSGKYKIAYEDGVKSGEYKLNAHLSFANIMENYGKFNRYKLNGTVNNIETDFNTIVPDKEQEELIIITSDKINLNKRVRTSIGDGIIKSASRKLSTGETKISLIYDNGIY